MVLHVVAHDEDPPGAARAMSCVAFAELSDYAADRATLSAAVSPGEMAAGAARTIIYALRARDWAVTAERERGTPWSVIAEALRCPEDALREQYEDGIRDWLAGSPDAPAQPGSPGGIATIGAVFASAADALTWFLRWVEQRRRGVLESGPPTDGQPAPI